MSTRLSTQRFQILSATFVPKNPASRAAVVYARDVLITAENGFKAFHGRSPNVGEIEASSAGVIGWVLTTNRSC